MFSEIDTLLNFGITHKILLFPINSSEQGVDFQAQQISDFPENTPSFKIFGLSENGTVSNQSVIFLLNVLA